ncbi:peptidyl-tRNA hydrolase, partial [Dietzia sp.]|uniref:peptidyl-tRNA hydrolase n=1 Tax=Dietzia sp. TaxID=1871616 RepID=UPI002FDAEE2C
AFVPQPLDGVDPLVQRLQVGGTDAPADEAELPEAGERDIEILVDGSLEMSAGKAAAQAGHGIMLVLGESSTERVLEWAAAGMPISASDAGAERWAAAVAAAERGEPGYAGVRDAGYTEVAPGSLTVVGIDHAAARQ